MKTFASLLCLFVLFAVSSQAQTLSGTLVYNRIIEFKKDDLPPEAKAMMGNMPSKMETEYELLFDKNKSFLRMSVVPEAGEQGGMGMMGPRMWRAAGGEKYCDFQSRMSTTQYELGEEVYVVQDSFEVPSWKLTNETKKILGYTCRKAITTKIFKRRGMGGPGEAGKGEGKEQSDTTEVTAWYTEEIPVPSGPEFEGTLPGMILELNMGEGRFRFEAIDYRKKYEKKALVPPTGTMITKAELREKQKAMFQNMRQQWRGRQGE